MEGVIRRHAARVCWQTALRVPLAMLIVLGVLARADAQPPQKIVYDKSLGTRRSSINQMLKSESLSDSEKARFDDFFYKHGFAELADPTVVDNLKKVRDRIRKYLSDAKSGPVYEHLNELAVEVMWKFITGRNDYNRVVKFNAILVLGDLNEREADGRGMAKPLLAAQGKLVGLVRSPRASDYMRLAALTGVRRFAMSNAQYPLSARAKAGVMSVMLGLLKQEEPPAQRTAEVHDWIRRRAAEILGDLGEPGATNDVIVSLLKCLEDPAGSIDFRCAAASALGKIKLPASSDLDYAAGANAIGQLVVDACRQESARARQRKEPVSRRRLMGWLYGLKHAIGGAEGEPGLAAMVPEEDKAFAAELYTKFVELLAVFEDPRVFDDQLSSEITAKRRALENVLKKPEEEPEPKKKDEVAANN